MQETETMMEIALFFIWEVYDERITKRIENADVVFTVERL